MSVYRAINAAADVYVSTRSSKDREELARAALPWCEELAQKRSRRITVHYDDLLSAATLGLVQSIDRYDGRCRFTSYAQRRIEGAMKDDAVIHGPRTRVQIKKRNALERAAFDAAQQRTTVSEETTAAINGEAKHCVRDLSFVSLDHAHSTETTEHGFDRVDRKDMFRFITRGLPRRDRMAVTMYFLDGLTMKQIGQAIGISESRVSQIITEAVGGSGSAMSRAKRRPLATQLQEA